MLGREIYCSVLKGSENPLKVASCELALEVWNLICLKASVVIAISRYSLDTSIVYPNTSRNRRACARHPNESEFMTTGRKAVVVRTLRLVRWRNEIPTGMARQPVKPASSPPSGTLAMMQIDLRENKQKKTLVNRTHRHSQASNKVRRAIFLPFPTVCSLSRFAFGISRAYVPSVFT